MKTLIIKEIKINTSSSTLDYETATIEQLTQPSIFDSDKIKDLKGLLIEINAKLQETLEQPQI